MKGGCFIRMNYGGDCNCCNDSIWYENNFYHKSYKWETEKNDDFIGLNDKKYCSKKCMETANFNFLEEMEAFHENSR
jgi:hypothetical protein